MAGGQWSVVSEKTINFTSHRSLITGHWSPNWIQFDSIQQDYGNSFFPVHLSLIIARLRPLCLALYKALSAASINSLPELNRQSCS